MNHRFVLLNDQPARAAHQIPIVMPMRFRFATLALLIAAADPAAADDERPVDFAKDIAPIFARSCVSCHGGDEQESGLRLDDGGVALKGGDRGPAVVPGKSGESLLYQAVTGQGDVSEMPADGTKLSDDEIALIKRWIDAGARVPEDAGASSNVAGVKSDHWAFQPIERSVPPAVENAAWLRDPIDAFVLARLGAESMPPSPEAEDATLLRRLSFDLRGVPPSIDELDGFLSDDGPDAYHRVVDRLLASPQFGERWARHWLDAARYADSNGFTIDGPRSIWKYRDWVIDAFNRDQPFDRFTIEQLAGDLLPDPTADQLIATGFHRNTLINQEGGTDQEQFRIDAVADRVDTTGTAWLGLTIGCARCHQHKYDPISQRDYYEFFALLNNCDEPQIRVPTPEQTAELARLDAEIAAAEKPLAEHDAGFLKGLPEWQERMSKQSREPVEWTVLDPLEFHSTDGSVLAREDGGSVFVDFTIPPQDTFTVVATLPLEGIAAVRLEALTHPSSPNTGPGRAENGNFVLSEFELLVGSDAATAAGAAAKSPAQWNRIELSRAVADHSQEGYSVSDAVDGKPHTGWAINVKRGSLNVNREAIFFLKQPLDAGGDAHGKARLAVRMHHRHKDPKYLIGRFRLSVGNASPELLEIPEAIRAILAGPEAQRTEADRDLLEDYYKGTDASRTSLAERVATLKKVREELDQAVPTTMILRERKQPRETHIHIRGDFLRPGANVSGGVPDVLPGFPEGLADPNRLDLARWLVDPENPLTARVTVNRFWQRLFGLGLVETENDFGTQGSEPSHPDLLDWLASEFKGQRSAVRSQSSEDSDAPDRLAADQRSARGSNKNEAEYSTFNVQRSTFNKADQQATDRVHHSPLTTHHSRPTWSVKRMLRHVVTSATYRQSSRVTDEQLRRDPRNRLLARQSRLRVEAELVRDVALAASGMLSTEMHGAGVHPPQPEGIYVLTQVKKPWPEEQDSDRYRRALYTYFWRSSPYPLLPTFDAPDANTACTRRPRSNTPLQALTLANDRAFHELAQGLAGRILREAPPYDEGRLRYVFHLCLSREPGELEEQRLLQFVAAQRQGYENNEMASRKSAPANIPDSVSVAEAAAWTAVARVMLNLDEFITRE